MYALQQDARKLRSVDQNIVGPFQLDPSSPSAVNAECRATRGRRQTRVAARKAVGQGSSREGRGVEIARREAQFGHGGRARRLLVGDDPDPSLSPALADALASSIVEPSDALVHGVGIRPSPLADSRF